MCFMNKCQDVSGKQTELHPQSVNLHYKNVKEHCQGWIEMILNVPQVEGNEGNKL